jgi:hypothetical protein
VDGQTLSQETFVEVEPAADERAAEIYTWRLEQLERAGFSRRYADPLAQDPAVDLHQACKLLARGCPERTAYLILA